MSNFADDRVGCVAGELRLTKDQHDTATSAIGGFYWRHEQSMRRWEAQLDSPCGVYGGFYAVRRALAVELPEGLILDDMYQPLSVVRESISNGLFEQRKRRALEQYLESLVAKSNGN